MSELRKNAVKNRWVAVVEDRALKPNDFPIARSGPAGSPGNGGFCPFCEGNEEHTPPEIASCRLDGSKPDGPGWLVRAIPNKFSAFELEGILQTRSNGIHTFSNGLGRHEVIIETPEHGIEFHELQVDRIDMLLRILKQRYNELAKDNRIKYIQIYKNQGLYAGASLKHTHSQIVGLPYNPGENSGMPLYYNENRKCLICGIMDQERAEETRLVFESENYIVLCPYASRFPYELWILPKRHADHFGDIEDSETTELAGILKNMTIAIMETLDSPSYNLIINTAPVNTPYEPGYHWFIELTPRLIINAGVEIATGTFINPVSPELAAGIYRKTLEEKN